MPKELQKDTLMGVWTSGTGFPMEREEKLVLEWEEKEKRRTTWGRVSPSLAGEVAAGGGSQLLQPRHSLGDNKMPGSWVLTVLRPPS